MTNARDWKQQKMLEGPNWTIHRRETLSNKKKSYCLKPQQRCLNISKNQVRSKCGM